GAGPPSGKRAILRARAKPTPRPGTHRPPRAPHAVGSKPRNLRYRFAARRLRGRRTILPPRRRTGTLPRRWSFSFCSKRAQECDQISPLVSRKQLRLAVRGAAAHAKALSDALGAAVVKQGGPKADAEQRRRHQFAARAHVYQTIVGKLRADVASGTAHVGTTKQDLATRYRCRVQALGGRQHGQLLQKRAQCGDLLFSGLL